MSELVLAGDGIQFVERSAANVHLIGLELRLANRNRNMLVEAAMIPMDLWLPRDPYAQWSLPCTLHTSIGDVGFEVQLPR